MTDLKLFINKLYKYNKLHIKYGTVIPKTSKPKAMAHDIFL